MAVTISIISILILIWTLHFFWLERVKTDLGHGAGIEYQRLVNQDATLLSGVTLSSFNEIYITAHTPRLPKYSLLTVSVFVIGMPIMFAALSAGIWYLERTAPTPAAVTDTLLLGRDGHAKMLARIPPDTLHYVLLDWAGFYYFFGMLFCWVVTVALIMYFYHKRRPDTLRTELLRAKAASVAAGWPVPPQFSANNISAEHNSPQNHSLDSH